MVATTPFATPFAASFPAWTAFTPVVISVVGALTAYSVNSAAYLKIGKVVFVRYQITITTLGTGSDSLFIDLPAASVGGAGALLQHIAGTNQLGVGWTGVINSTNQTHFRARRYDGGFAITNGDVLTFEGVYEAA